MRGCTNEGNTRLSSGHVTPRPLPGPIIVNLCVAFLNNGCEGFHLPAWSLPRWGELLRPSDHGKVPSFGSNQKDGRQKASGGSSKRFNSHLFNTRHLVIRSKVFHLQQIGKSESCRRGLLPSGGNRVTQLKGQPAGWQCPGRNTVPMPKNRTTNNYV